ncbi:MAG: menaquinone biosynthesis protein [Candidatus Schekmanbacteria bacterium]|nr:menaquinone biosynthesis protein [Candidatus Schekmanbacteria bacterium]
MPKKIRLGLISYLNTKPLIYPLLTGELKHNFDISLAPPSILAKSLEAGEIDIGLIPAIEYATRKDYLILPDMGLSSMGEVRSVLLYARKPMAEIKSVALDESSRASAAMVKILLARRLKETPKYIQGKPPLSDMLQSADAALIIGDNALKPVPTDLYRMDLGAEWKATTGQPFVFALYVARPVAGLAEAYATLIKSKEIGMFRIPQIARVEAERLNLSYESCLEYLTKCIYYNLSPAKIAGLELYYKMACELHLIKREVTLKFYQKAQEIPLFTPGWRLANA